VGLAAREDALAAAAAAAVAALPQKNQLDSEDAAADLAVAAEGAVFAAPLRWDLARWARRLWVRVAGCRSEEGESPEWAAAAGRRSLVLIVGTAGSVPLVALRAAQREWR